MLYLKIKRQDMKHNREADIHKDIKKLRIKILVFLIVFIVPAIILDRIHSGSPEISSSPAFMISIFLIILLVTISLFVLLFSKCPTCKQGYFSKYGMPKLYYKLTCQNCGFNVFKPYKNDLS